MKALPSDSKTRVLNIVHGLGFGGIERYLLRLIQHMDSARWQMDVLCKGSRQGELLSEYERLGVRVLECRQGYVDPLSWWRLRRVLVQGRYDVVADFTGDFAGVPLLLARTAGVGKRIAWYRSASVHYRHGIRDLYARGARWLVTRFGTDILSNSVANLDAFHPRRNPVDSRFGVIANGLPVEQFEPDPTVRLAVRDELGLPEEAMLVGHVGRFRHAKNHEAIVAAAARVCRERDEVRFVLVGDGEGRSDIEQAIEQAGLGDRFILLGNRGDVPRILQGLDVFLFPSRFEGLPNALIEAMLAGVPCVASNVASVLEALPPEEHQFTAAPEDAEALAELVVKRLLRPDPAGRHRLRQWCIERYSMENSLRLVCERMTC